MLSATSSLDLNLDRVNSSSFDKWLQIHYLPSGFKCNEEELQDQSRKRWYKRIKFDLRELCNFFSIAIMVIWILSLIIFIIYFLTSCSPIKRNKHANMSTTTTAYNDTIAPYSPTTQAINFTDAIALERFLGQEEGKEDETVDKNKDCVMLSTFAISNICLSTLLLVHLFCYIFHIVELLENFPWFAVEIAYASIFVLVTFTLAVILCITSTAVISGLFIILGIIQFACGMLFLISRCNQCKSGRPPQDLSDDVDGDFLRTNLKNIFQPKSRIPEEVKANYKKKFILSTGKQAEHSARDVFQTKIASKMVKSRVSASKNQPYSLSSCNSSRKAAVKSALPKSRTKITSTLGKSKGNK